MAANDIILAEIPIQNGELTVKNTDGTYAFTPGMAVVLDATNVISGTQGAVGAVRGAANGVPLGIVKENIAQQAYGRVACLYTAIFPAVASGAISVNTAVGFDAAGQVRTCPAGQPQAGWALTAAASAGDQILIGLGGPARNA